MENNKMKKETISSVENEFVVLYNVYQYYCL